MEGGRPGRSPGTGTASCKYSAWHVAYVRTMKSTLDQVHSNVFAECKPEKRFSIEHRAGKAARLTSWRKMTQPGEFFVGDGSFRGCPMGAHFPRNETLDSFSTLSS
jgi:hypothetical protein